MKALLIRWGRRWIAGLLVIAMLSGTVPAAFAAEVGQGVTESGTVSGTESGENAVPDEVLLSEESDLGQAPSSDTDNVTDTGGSSDTDASSDTDTSSNTDTSTGTDSSTDTAPEGDNTGLQEETLLQDEELLLEDDLVSEQSIAILTDDEGLAAVAADDAYSISTLGDAAQIAQSLVEEGNVAPLKVNGTEISINQSAGLVLLSNVNPKEYSSYTINLTMLDAGINYFDLVTAVEIKDTEGKVTAYPFRGLGGTGTPFAGQIVFAQESNKPIQLSRALFRALSTQASFLEYISTNTPKSATLTFDVSKGVSGPVLAEEVSAGNEADWSIILSGSAAIGGIIGTISSGTVNLTATVADGVALTCSSSPNAGFFCNTLLGGSLNATLSGSGSITVTATSGDAGGFVGEMAANTTLTANAAEGMSVSITSVTASADSSSAGGLVGEMLAGATLNANTAPSQNVSGAANAGGLVGRAYKAVIKPASNLAITEKAITGEKQNANVGGLFGEYTQSNHEINLSSYTISNNTITAGGSFGGGIFGKLINSGGSITISGATDNTIGSTGSNAYTYGGLLGIYEANSLTDELVIKNLTVNSSVSNNTNYGGIIGKLMTTCYVEMSGLTANTSGGGTFGGLVAWVGEPKDTNDKPSVLLNVENVTVSTSSNITDGSKKGGLVGYLQRGVVRLSGTTDLSKVTISADETRGKIVGQNDDGLVYATGTGKENSGWTMNGGGDASNIGNWGEVVRLDGTKLTGDSQSDNLFYFNSDKHTLTISNVAPSDDGSYTLSDTKDFAGYALAYNYGTTLLPVLTFKSPVDANTPVTLTGDVVLTGTGILGIGRDNGGRNAFASTFDGQGHTITLDIGNSTGKLWARQRNNDIKSHGYLGLFAKVGTAEIKNVTVSGDVTMSVLNGSEGNDTQKRDQALRVAGLAAYQSGDITCQSVNCGANVTVDIKPKNSPMVMVAGMVAQGSTNTHSTYTNCKWTSTLTNNRDNANDRVAGFLAQTNGQVEITVDRCELSGSITSASTTDARVGGLVADIEENSTGTSRITLKNLTVSATVSAAKAGKNNYCGGLLGCHWYSTNVDFGGEGVTGVTVSGARLNAGKARFGGLVYQATGHWDATANDSIKFTGTDGKKTTIIGTTGDHRGLLVGDGLHDTPKKALYLEVGTWGGNGTAYWIDSSNVQLVDANRTPLSGQFDELVGCTTYANGGLSGNDNAIVSLQTGTGTIDTGDTVPNTYTTQFPGTSYTSPQTRYYYNLSNMSTSKTLTTAQQVTTWSASQFAASNIRTILYAGANDPVTISNGNTEIDLTHYSYYPVTPLSTVTVQNATLKFGYDTIQSAEATNKQPSDANHQHYLMQCGLLYNTTRNVTVEDVTLSGVVGKTTNGSGALIYGTVSGTSDSPTTVSLTRVTLSGLRVNGVDSNTTYAPLLINNAESYVNLTVDNLRTGTGYLETAADGTETTNTLTAATSLIGNVGSETATNLNLMFSNIALDSRIDARAATAVNNNEDANCQVEYNTTRSIFTKATLLNCFQYSADSSGIYNFYTYSNMVTYGVESSQSIQNEGEQYEYYDGGYICDGLKTKPADDTAAARYFDAGTYRPYVAEWKNQQNNRHELNVNKKPKNLFEGCGTYGDPYLIKDGKQLVTLAYYLNNATVSKADGFTVNFNTYVLGKQYDDGGDYHTLGGSANDLEYVFAYDENGGTWASDGVDELISADVARTYLLNAYFQVIQEDGKQIIIKANDYVGLGTQANPFSGVIVGKDSPTVFLNVNNSGAQDFGGLIRYSRGSVVKDLAVDYSGATITMTNSAVPSYTNNPFFGGVVGYCMGGDTIIDNVSVRYASRSDGTKSVTLSGTHDRLIAAGGYVGLVGGAKDSGNDNYEKTGGGVVFRNMGSHTNNFATYQTNANDGSGYFYCNPYVGRVLDGYACYDGGTAGQSTLNNTDKNYTIPDVTGNSGLAVSQASDGSLTATVSTAQGLWLLSAIVNSGAGAMDSTGTYQDVENQVVDAYQTGKPRTGSYNLIGQAGGASDLADEAYWGGVDSKKNTDDAKNRVSYLVKNFTTAADDVYYYAARLTGKVSNAATNNPVALTFATGTIDMSSYGNGFRGIGGSYGQKNTGSTSDLDKVQRRSLYVTGVSGIDTMTTIKLAMDQHDYEEEYESIIWSNQGAGLFTVFMYKAGSTDPCQVQNLTISGTVSVRTYTINNNGNECGINKTTYDMGVGGFASRPAKSQNQKLKFSNFHLIDLHVTGGTSTGGVIGLNECAGAIEFNNWSIINTKVYKWVTNDGSTGGFVGWHHSGKSFIINGYGSPSEQGSDRQWNIQNLSVTVQANEQKYGNIGGLTGANDDSEVSITDVNIKGMTVTGIAARDVGGLADGGSSKITVKNCWLEDIEVSGETNSDNKPSGSVGGVLGFCNNNGTTIENVTITGNSSVKSSGGNVGGLIGEARNATAVKDCHITGSSDKPILVRNSASNYAGYAGGLVGKSSNNITISACTETYLNILANGNDAAGLIGKMEGNNVATKASNVVFSHVIAAVKASGKSIGLLTGYIDSSSNTRNIYGYNILADSCKVGWNNSKDISIDTLAEAELYTTRNTGLWLGGIKAQDHKLVAVAVKGMNQPQTDVGSIVSGSVQITYADYPAVQDNQPQSGTASPWVDVNPTSMVKIKESATSTDTVTLTGNGVGYMTGSNGETIPVAEAILWEVKAGKGKYHNLVDGKEKTFSQFLDPNNSAYLTTYQKEEQKGGAAPVTIDFPILVVTSLTDTNTLIWNYIAALTNVASGKDAQGQAKSVTATTYQWKNGSFVADGNSLSVSGTYIGVTPNAFDNQKSQFTLLAVKYSNPTYNSKDANPGPQYFTLYVPVLVKKVLQATYTVRMLAGTDYYPGSYTSTSHAVADFNEPVTALIEYNYKRTKAEWQEALDNGENLLWYYEKTLNLIGSNSADGKSLPAGSRLTLVDVATGKSYTHEMKEGDDNKSFSCGVMVDTSDSEEKFEPLPICDRLNITESQTGTGKKYVKIEGDDTNQATVKSKDGACYRLANDDEEGVYLHVGDDSVKDGKLAEPERYFLTIQVPESEDSGIINNMLESAMKRSPNAPPAELNKDTGNSGGRYVLYESIQQDQLTVKTEHLDKDGNADNDTEMNNNDAIRVTLSSTLSLTDNGRNYYTQGYKPTGLNHQFIINLKKVVDDVTIDSILGATGISWEYKVGYKNENNEFVSLNSSRDSYPPGELDAFTLSSGKEIERNMVTWMDERSSLTIQAVITLQYGNNAGSVFPPRTDENDTTTGCFVQAESRVANLENQLSITGNKETAKDSSRYYCTVPTFASLSFDAIDYGGERTLQLGINCDDDYQPRIIQTSSVYDYSGVDSETLQKAKKVRYTLELFQKQTDNKYTGSALPLISSYVSVNGDNWNANTQGDKLIMEMDFTYDGGNTSISMPIELAPLTGPEFEKEGYTYANYMVRLTAVLLEKTTEGDYQPIESTKASDFVIYTNARVYQGIIPEPAS